MPSDSASSRRDFLTGRSAQQRLADSARGAADALAGAMSAVASPSGGDTLRLAARAMNCEFAVILNPGPSEQIVTASAALDLVAALEAQMTVYRPDSELWRLNAQAAATAVAVEPRLFDLLLEARRISRETDGAFDPTSGPLIALWRRCRDEGRIPTQAEIDTAREQTGIERIDFDQTERTVRFNRPGVELNLGAIGKGHALDRMAEQLGQSTPAAALSSRGAEATNAPQSLRDTSEDPESCRSSTQGAPSRTLGAFLLHGGHSSILARGDHNRTGGWPVGLRHPAFPTEHMATLLLKDIALSTSGAGEQFYRHEGKRYGHILDPRTGWPAEAMLSVTVLAPTAAEADALSTAFFVGGVEIARRYCDNHPEVSALFTPPMTRGRTVEIETLNVPDGVLFPAGDVLVSKST